MLSPYLCFIPGNDITALLLLNLGVEWQGSIIWPMHGFAQESECAFGNLYNIYGD